MDILTFISIYFLIGVCLFEVVRCIVEKLNSVISFNNTFNTNKDISKVTSRYFVPHPCMFFIFYPYYILVYLSNFLIKLIPPYTEKGS